MTPEQIAACFSGPEGFFCARWGRPIAPVVFGAAEETVAMMKGAVETLCLLTGHKMAEMDPEMGTNLMVFFCADWAELRDLPDLDALIGEPGLPERLIAAQATQTRVFRHDEDGAIRAAFLFLRIAGPMADLPADLLALDQAVRIFLTWGADAFADRPPLVQAEGHPPMLRPEIARLLRAAYDPVLPACACDAAHGLRLFARMEAQNA